MTDEARYTYQKYHSKLLLFVVIALFS